MQVLCPHKLIRSFLHGASSGPVELLTCHGQNTAHALQDIAHLLVHLVNPILVLVLSFTDGGYDVVTVSLCQGNIVKRSV